VSRREPHNQAPDRSLSCSETVGYHRMDGPGWSGISAAEILVGTKRFVEIIFNARTEETRARVSARLRLNLEAAVIFPAAVCQLVVCSSSSAPEYQMSFIHQTLEDASSLIGADLTQVGGF